MEHFEINSGELRQIMEQIHKDYTMKNRQTGYYWARTKGNDEEEIVYYDAVIDVFYLMCSDYKYPKNAFAYISDEKLEFKRNLQHNAYYLIKKKKDIKKDIGVWNETNRVFYAPFEVYSILDVVVLSDPINLETLEVLK